MQTSPTVSQRVDRYMSRELSPDESAELHGTDPAAEWEAEQEACDRASGRA